MNSRLILILLFSVLLLLLMGRCGERPPWPGAGDVSKDRTSEHSGGGPADFHRDPAYSVIIGGMDRNPVKGSIYCHIEGRINC